MANLTLPAIAKIVEMRMRILVPLSDPKLALNRRMPIGPAFREMWLYEVALAPVAPEDTRKLVAALERMDGKINPFTFSLKSFSRAASLTASVVAAPATGSVTVRLNFTPTGVMLKRGTLISLGDITTSTYQVVEVLADVLTASDTTVTIAPRVRRKFTTGSAVAVANVQAKAKLNSDDISNSRTPTSGVVSFSALEAI